MGCCLSSHKPPKKEPNGPNDHINHHHFHLRSPAPEMATTQVGKTQTQTQTQNHTLSPHPPVVEEESVKEVLSETPVSKPPTPETFSEKKTHYTLKQLETEAVNEVSEASQVSEACEVSESFSYLSTTTTTTITEVRDEDEAISKRKREVGPRVTNGSSGITRRKRPNCGNELAGRRGSGNELAGRRGRGPISPAGKPDRSTEKRNRVEGKSIRGRESGQVRTTQRGGGYIGVRRDIGELSSRRSRSPAPRTTGGVSRGGLARNSSKGTGPAGGRSLGGEGENQSESNGGKKEEQNDVGSSQLGNESLENPLVALECFIFV